MGLARGARRPVSVYRVGFPGRDPQSTGCPHRVGVHRRSGECSASRLRSPGRSGHRDTQRAVLLFAATRPPRRHVSAGRSFAPSARTSRPVLRLQAACCRRSLLRPRRFPRAQPKRRVHPCPISLYHAPEPPAGCNASTSGTEITPNLIWRNYRRRETPKVLKRC